MFKNKFKWVVKLFTTWKYKFHSKINNSVFRCLVKSDFRMFNFFCFPLPFLSVLAEDVSEVKAWQCKAVALINLEQFPEALTTINKSKFFAWVSFLSLWIIVLLIYTNHTYRRTLRRQVLTPCVLKYTRLVFKKSSGIRMLRSCIYWSWLFPSQKLPSEDSLQRLEIKDKSGKWKLFKQND